MEMEVPLAGQGDVERRHSKTNLKPVFLNYNLHTYVYSHQIIKTLVY